LPQQQQRRRMNVWLRAFRSTAAEGGYSLWKLGDRPLNRAQQTFFSFWTPVFLTVFLGTEICMVAMAAIK
jgi:hypothetical protein